jgi:hypothetical protein
MKLVEPEKLIREYERCCMTPLELQSRLIQAAAGFPPEEFASLIPAGVFETIREVAASPPARLEETPRIFAISTCTGPGDSEAEERPARRLWYDGIWRWHRFFQPKDRPRIETGTR